MPTFVLPPLDDSKKTKISEINKSIISNRKLHTIKEKSYLGQQEEPE